jgi:hypothetical protein
MWRILSPSTAAGLSAAGPAPMAQSASAPAAALHAVFDLSFRAEAMRETTVLITGGAL